MVRTSALLLVLLCGCASDLSWQGKIWRGSSGESAIERRQDQEKILCKDIQFDDYVCVHEDEFLINLKKQVSCE